MHLTLVRTGHGYETGSRGRCTAFDGITILANPLGGFSETDRKNRIFESGNYRIDYGSHVLALGRDTETPHIHYRLVHHGVGREVWRFPDFSDNGELLRHILAMPERVQYALLHSMSRLAGNARHEAQRQTRTRWTQAILDKRIKKSRRRGMVYVDIVPETATEGCQFQDGTRCT